MFFHLLYREILAHAAKYRSGLACDERMRIAGARDRELADRFASPPRKPRMR